MTDREYVARALRVIETGDLSELEPELRANIEARVARARAEREAAPPEPQMLALTPRVCDLIRSLLKAAGCKPGEWSRWLAEAKAADAAEREPRTAPEPAKERPQYLRLVRS